MPPPRVSPAMPVCEICPPGTASPCACVSRSTSPQSAPGLGVGDAGHGVDAHPAHPGEVEDEAAVDGRVPGGRVAAAADGELEPRLARVVHDGDDVDRALDARDRCGPPVEHAVPDPARRVVVRVAGEHELAAELLREAREGRAGQGGGHRSPPSLNSL